jgi:hypothetical protein
MGVLPPFTRLYSLSLVTRPFVNMRGPCGSWIYVSYLSDWIKGMWMAGSARHALARAYEKMMAECAFEFLYEERACEVLSNGHLWPHTKAGRGGSGSKTEIPTESHLKASKRIEI